VSWRFSLSLDKNSGCPSPPCLPPNHCGTGMVKIVVFRRLLNIESKRVAAFHSPKLCKAGSSAAVVALLFFSKIEWWQTNWYVCSSC